MTYIIMLVSGLFGICFHILMAVRQLNNALPKENYKGVLKAYFEKDFWCLGGSVLAVLFAIFICAPHLQMIDPGAAGDTEDRFVYFMVKWARISFAVLGYFGDSIIFGLFGTIGKTLADKGLKSDPPSNPQP